MDGVAMDDLGGGGDEGLGGGGGVEGGTPDGYGGRASRMWRQHWGAADRGGRGERETERRGVSAHEGGVFYNSP